MPAPQANPVIAPLADILRGRTRGELSRATGYDRAYISRILSGRQTPSLRAIPRLAAALGVSRAYLVGVFTTDDWERDTAA